MSEKQQQKPQQQQLQNQQQPIHQVQCDDCKRWPVNGWAYRCGHCPVSLCQACILFTQHDPEHVFLLLKKPMDPRYKQERVLGLTPYTWSTPLPLGAVSLGKPVYLSFPGSEMTTCTFGSGGSSSNNNAPTLEHAKGPLFDRASELAHPVDTQPTFGMHMRVPTPDQMTMDMDQQRARGDSTKPSFSFGIDSRGDAPLRRRLGDF